MDMTIRGASLTSVRRALWTGVALTAALVVALVVWNAAQGLSERMDGARREGENLARALAGHVARTVEASDQVLLEVEDDIRARGGVARIGAQGLHELLRARAASRPLACALYLYDNGGRLYAGSTQNPPPQPARTPDYVTRLLADPRAGIYIGMPGKERTSGRWVVPLAHRLTSADGTPMGVLAVAIDPESFTHIYDGFDLETHGVILVVRADGMGVVRYPSIESGSGTDFKALVEQARQSAGRTILVPGIGDDNERIVATRFLPDGSAAVMVGIATEPRYGAWRTDVLRQALFALLPLAVMGMLLRLLLKQIDRVEQEGEELNVTKFTLDHTSDMAVWLDAAGRLRFANPAAVKCFGYPRETLLGTGVEQLFPGYSIDCYRRDFEKLKETGTVTRRSQYRNHEGAVQPVEINSSFMVYKGEAFNCAIMRDVTERDKALEALRESEERFSKVFYLLPEVITITDLETGRYIDVNHVFPALSGYGREEVIGRTALEIGIWADRAERDALVEALKRDGEVRDREVRFRRKDGSILIGECSATVFEVGGKKLLMLVTRDVSEQRAASQALRESEERFSKIFRLLPHVVTVMDMNGGHLDFNQAYSALTGYTREEALGRSADELNIWVDLADRASMIEEVLRCGEIRNREYRFRHKDGHIHLCECSAVAFEVQGRKLMFLLTRDVTEERLASSALQESEERYELAARGAEVGIWDWDVVRDDLYLSSHFEQLLGFGEKELAGGSSVFLDRLPREDRTMLRLAMRETVRNGARLQLELRARRKDGSYGWYRLSGAATRGADGRTVRVAGSLTDVSQEKQAEFELRHSEERLKRIFELSPIGIVISEREDGRILDVNESVLHMTGFTREEMIGHTATEIGYWESSEQRSRAYRALFEEGRPTQLEHRLRTRAGDEKSFLASVGLIDIDGKQRVLTVLQDITERKRAEVELRRSEERFAKIFHSSPSAMAFTTFSDGRYISVNGAWSRLFGYSLKEVAGRSVADIGIWTDWRDRERVIDMLERDERVRELEIRFRRKSGEELDTLYSAEIVEFEGERLLLSAIVDVTARKQAQDEVRKLNETLEQRVRERTMELVAANRELESFSYSVSHDLRSPLRSMQGFSSILIQEHAERIDSDARHLLERIAAAGLRMSELIDGLLVLSRLTRQEMRRESVDLSALARGIASDLQQGDPARSVEFAIEDDVVGLADRELIGNLLENLIGNAWKYTARKPLARIEFGRFQEDGTAVYFVRDNGAGFDLRYSDRLFGAFQRLHSPREFEGTGIGLATAQRIVHRHGGRIWAEAEVDKGATFHFTLG